LTEGRLSGRGGELRCQLLREWRWETSMPVGEERCGPVRVSLHLDSPIISILLA